MKRVFKQIGLLAMTSVFALAIFNSPVKAEDVLQSTNDLDEVVVTADRFENTLINTPRNITIITAEDIEKSGATTVMDAIKNVPGVTVADWTGSGKTGIIDLRGQGESAKNNVLVLIDGISVNSIDMSGPDYSTISVDQIERIEVLPGGSGVIYGDKAIGGVINIITKKANKDGIASYAKLETGSYGMLNYGFNTSYKKDKLSADINIFHKYNDGYRKNSDFKADDLQLKASYTLNQSNEFGAAFTYHTDDYGMPGALTETAMNSDRTQTKNPNDSASTDEKNFSLCHKFTNKKLTLENSLNLKNRETEAFSEGSWGTYKANRDADSMTLNSKAKISLKNNDLILGIDYLNGSTKDKNLDNKVEKKALGLFVQDKYHLSEQLFVSGGLRNEETELKYYTNANKKYNETLAECSLNYLYSEIGSLYLNYGQNYRTPTTDEYYEAAIPFYKPEHYNENLKPQKGDTIEAGLKSALGNGYIKTSIYRTQTTDEIYYNGDHNDNMPGKTVRTGLEVSSEQQINAKVSINASYAMIDTEVKDGPYKGKEVPGVPEQTFSLGSDIGLASNLKMNVAFNYVGKQYAISDVLNAASKVDAYKVINTKLSYNMKNAVAYLGVNNLFNEKYSQYVVCYGSKGYYPSPERNYYFGMKYNF